MSDLMLLPEAQMRRIEPYFPLPHVVPRVDDGLVLSGIVFVLRNGLRWRDTPKEYGPHKTRFLAELTAKRGKPEQLMIDATHMKAHRTTASLLKKGMLPDRIGRTKGGLNSKLHAVCDGHGRPLILLLSEGQMIDYKGAAKTLHAFPKAKMPLADKGYGAEWFRDALAERKISACIASRANRKVAIPRDPALYKKRHKIENMFCKLKDWRRIHTRYDRCAHTFFSSICIAATVIFWL